MQFATRAVKYIEYRTQIVVSAFVCFFLAIRNLTSRRTVVDPRSGVVLSITTHGPRTRRVFLSLEAISRGRALPSRLILWLDDPSVIQEPPKSLVRLSRRGLEIRSSANFGPHTKYYNSIADASICDGKALVTGDDDTLYPRFWLEQLVEESRESPETMIGYRARFMNIEAGRIGPYRSWLPHRGTEANCRIVILSVSGTLYPPSLQTALRRAGTSFLDVCPLNDDVWTHAVALRNLVPVRQVGTYAQEFRSIPGSQLTSLARVNVRGGGNDEQIRATYTDRDIASLSTGGSCD